MRQRVENVDQVLKSPRKEKECLGSSVNDCIKGQKASFVNRNWRKGKGEMIAFWSLAGSKECAHSFCGYEFQGRILNSQVPSVGWGSQRNGSDKWYLRKSLKINYFSMYLLVRCLHYTNLLPGTINIEMFLFLKL